MRGIHDDKGDPAFGTIAMPNGFVQSSNIYFATLAANAATADVFHDTLTAKWASVAFPKQAAFDADLPYIGFGQGRMWASPLEMARLACAVANNGQMMQARFVSEMVDPGKDERDKTRKKDYRAATARPEHEAGNRQNSARPDAQCYQKRHGGGRVR